MNKIYLIVIDENLAQELLNKGMELIVQDSNNKTWTFVYDKNIFTFDTDKKDKCFITDRLKMNF